MEIEDHSAAGQALVALRSALEQLTAVVEAGGLDSHDVPAYLQFLQQFEQVRNRMAVVDHRLLTYGTKRDVAGALCQGRMSRVLTQALRISAAEANRRLRAAEQLGPRSSMPGEPLPPRRPALAAAQRQGDITPEQVDVVLRGLAKVDRVEYDPAAVRRGEEQLTDLATACGPKDLQGCTDRFVDHLDPDGSRPLDELVADRRHLSLVPRRDGGWDGVLHLTGTLGSKLNALLRPLARPRTNHSVGPAGRPVEELDGRTSGQRMHDALEDVCDRLLRAGDQPESGGVPTTVIVTIDEGSLRARTGHATTSDGLPVSVAQLLELADQAEIIPAVLNRSGAVLSLGRSRRIASRSQTLALVARDGGCSFPGCDHPPQWCERHHIKAWIDGGGTDLDNLTLLCRYHHHNFASRGWSCELDGDRLPRWRPPRYVDRGRTPLLNSRIAAARRRFTTAA